MLLIFLISASWWFVYDCMNTSDALFMVDVAERVGALYILQKIVSGPAHERVVAVLALADPRALDHRAEELVREPKDLLRPGKSRDKDACTVIFLLIKHFWSRDRKGRCCKK